MRIWDLKAHPSFSGALLWPFVYPWPQRPAGLVDQAFTELAKRWKPILDAFDEVGVDVGYELHPGEDLHDGISFEMFVDYLDGHPRAQINYDPSHFMLQQLDYLSVHRSVPRPHLCLSREGCRVQSYR